MWKQRWELHSGKPRHRKDGCQVPEAKTSGTDFSSEAQKELFTRLIFELLESRISFCCLNKLPALW